MSQKRWIWYQMFDRTFPKSLGRNVMSNYLYKVRFTSKFILLLPIGANQCVKQSHWSRIDRLALRRSIGRKVMSIFGAWQNACHLCRFLFERQIRCYCLEFERGRPTTFCFANYKLNWQQTDKSDKTPSSVFAQFRFRPVHPTPWRTSYCTGLIMSQSMAVIFTYTIGAWL